ncbi:MAG: cupin domain-containing protein [Pseudolabrys sp.]|nr:cupin domain-containing protein [Pseudolabrys sp.]
MKRLVVVAALAAFALAGVAVAQQPPVSPAPVKRTMVGKVEVPGANYEVVTAIVEIAPNIKAGLHTHPGDVFFAVTEGEFWLAIQGQPEKVFKAGEQGLVPSKAVHNEGAQGAGPAKLVATYVIEKGQPLVQPVK